MKASLVLLAIGIVALGGYLWMTGGGEAESIDSIVAAIGDGAPVVDVRTVPEFRQGHVAGAIHADVLDADFRELVTDLPRDEPVYVYCASGVRSGRAARVLEAMGFERVVNAGGFQDLADAGASVAR
ncbi:rhodanese-like domain-containing protein [Rubrivirga sp. IMCC43871]|uniref:rhodanese-like domain-containing protein n=1 Tax=Rubrivirga sp. IMCC43871 TaxID=3391575 RepID=UPI00398FD05D